MRDLTLSGETQLKPKFIRVVVISKGPTCEQVLQRVVVRLTASGGDAPYALDQANTVADCIIFALIRVDQYYWLCSIMPTLTLLVASQG